MKKIFIVAFCLFATQSFAQTINEFECKIEKKIDKFTNRASFSSPYFKPINIYRDDVGMRKLIYLSLQTSGSSISIGETGAMILFSDKTRMSFPDVKIKLDNDSDGYQYTAFIPLNLSQADSFKNKVITDFRLYIYDQEISPENGEMIRGYMKCILEAKK